MSTNERDAAETDAMLEAIRTVRQARLYRPEPVPDDVLHELLELARWTGSSRNSQPWRFIVITDKDELYQLSRLRERINWMADAPMAIAIVLDGEKDVSEAYDEGRVTERLLIGARVLGLGGGVAWFNEEEAEAKRILGIPADRTARSVVVIGYPISTKDPRPGRNTPGRAPLSELVSYERWGEAKR